MAFSPYYSDSAHAAFADRFKPNLASLIAETSSRNGKVFLLLALSYVERVQQAGERIHTEIFSDRPVRSVGRQGGKIAVTVGSEEDEQLFEVSLEALKLGGAAVDRPTTITLSELASSSPKEGGKPNGASWWADRPVSSQPITVSDEVLIGALKAQYSLEDPVCRVRRARTEIPSHGCFLCVPGGVL